MHSQDKMMVWFMALAVCMFIMIMTAAAIAEANIGSMSTACIQAGGDWVHNACIRK